MPLGDEPKTTMPLGDEPKTTMPLGDEPKTTMPLRAEPMKLQAAKWEVASQHESSLQSPWSYG